MSDFGDKYLSLFLAEGRELVEEMGDRLRSLKDGDDSALDALFRSAHSLKGMAASLDHEEVSKLAHAAEDAFTVLRGGEAEVDEGVSNLLWSAVDALAEMLDRIEAGESGSCGEEVGTQIRSWVDSHASRSSEEKGEKEARASTKSGPTGEGPVEVLGPETEDEETIKGKGESSAAPRLEIRIRLRQDVELPAARAAVLRARLSSYGEVVGSGGEPQEGGELAFSLVTDRAGSDIASALRREEGVSDVEVRLPVAMNGSRQDRMVRVPADLMDLLLEEATEILVHHAHLEKLSPSGQVPEMRFALARLKTTASRILNGLLEARLLPFDAIVPRLERTVRELERRLGKPADLQVRNREIRLDRGVLEGLVEPLTHLLRNSMDHGLEDAERRAALGKPERGRLTLSLSQNSDTIHVVLEDDGAGMDEEAILEKAEASGAVDAAVARNLDHEDRLMLATLSGVSTAAEATEVSGRGIGLDAVRDRVESLGGSVSLSTEKDRGTQVTLRLPPSVALLQVFLVRAAGEIYAVPVRKVRETVPIRPGSMRRINGRAVLPCQGDVAEAFPLHAALCGRLSVAPDHGTALIYVQRGQLRAAVVDEVLGCKELVIKPLLGPLEAMGELTGAAVLGDGTVAPVLDLENIGPPMEALARRTA